MIFLHRASSKQVLTFFVICLLTISIIPFVAIQPVTAAETPVITLKWTATVSGGGEALLAYDAIPEIAGEEVFHAGGQVQPSSQAGSVTCVNGRTGEQIYKIPIYGIGDTATMQMADVDNDGKMEILVALQHPGGLFILNAEDGSILWNAPGTYNGHPGYFTPIGGRIDGSGVVGDTDGDGTKDIFIGVMAYETQPTTGKIIHYEWDGSTIVELGRVQVWHPCAGGLSLGDTDNDGIPELYMNERDAYFGDGSWGRGTTCFDVWDGSEDVFEVRWRIYDWGASSDIPMLIDVNKDGQLEVVTTNLGRGIMVLNSTDGKPIQNEAGTTLKATNLGMHAHYQASIYDIDQDGNPELLCADGKESGSFGTQVFDLWSWTLDADIPAGYSFRGPSIGEVTGDGQKDIIVVTFDLETDTNPGNQDIGTVQVYNRYYEKLFEYGGLRHRAIGSVVQDVDRNDGGRNELLVLTQGGRIYCFDTPGLSEESQGRPRARSEVHFFSESRLGASEYVPFNRPYPDVTSNSPSNGQLGVATELASLSFTLDHPNSELMDYAVTADFGISAASGNDVGDGQRTVTVNGPLATSTVYHWNLTVTDDSGDAIVKQYSFTTGPYMPNRDPTQTTPSLSGTTILDDLVATPQGTTDLDGDAVTNIFNWQKAGQSLANINLPFETQTDPQDSFSGIANTKDYAYGAIGDVFGATWVPEGKVGGAYSFDGNDFIRFPQPSASSTRFDGNGGWSEMSVESWVKASTMTSTERLIVKSDLYRFTLPGEDNETSPEISYRLDCSNTGTALAFTWRVGVGPTNPLTAVQPIYTLGPLSVTSDPSGWHHVVVTYKSGAGLRLYVDGVMVSSLLGPSYTGNVFNTDGPFEIAFGSGSDFRGLVDEVRLYPYEVSSAMVNQRYLDTKDGLSTSSTISKYDTNIGDLWRCQVTPNDGLVDGTTTNTATATIVDAPNEPPSASNLAILPASPLTADNLVASYTYSDPEGNPEYGSIVNWYKNGVFNFSNPTLPNSLTTRGEVWSYRVTPLDGFEFGYEVISGIVTIGNTAPSFTGGLISPDPALDSSTLMATPSGWTDADGDAAGYTYQWQIKVGDVYTDIAGQTSQTLSTTYFGPNDWIAVKITAFDGFVSGNTLTFETNIIDSDPPFTGTPVVSGSRDDDELTGTAVGTSDPDGDSVINIFNWLKGSGSGTSTTNLFLPFETRSATSATDYSGYGNNGAVTGGTWTSQGRIGGAYSFDGNDVITVADSASLGNDGTWNELTVEYWVYPSVDQGRTVILNKNGESASTMGKYMTGFMRAQGATPNNVIFFGVYTAISAYEEPSFSQTYDNIATRIPTGQWSHVVGTYEAGIGLKLYINGALASQLPGVTGSIQPSVDEVLNIGYSSPIAGTSNRYFRGSLDEIRIYPTVLSAAQIFKDYADQSDGISDKATIVPQETSSGEIWRCQVTPNDGWQDGEPKLSDTVNIVTGNTVPHIDSYSPVDATTQLILGNSLNLMVTATDPDAGTLTYKWFLDTIEQAGATTSTWTYTPTSASLHTVRAEVSDGTTTLNHEWSVNVQVSECNLTVTTVGSGTVSKNPDQAIYQYGDLITLTATPDNADWTFAGWSGDVTSNDNPLQFNIAGDTEITATFTDQNVLTVNTVGSGTVNKTPDQQYYADGTVVALNAVAATGWTFSGWSGDLSGNTNPTTITMDGHKTVTATFTQNQYTLTVNVVGTGCSVTKNPNQATYTYGTEVDLSAVEADGWDFSAWSGDASGTSPITTVTIDDDMVVTATFIEEPPYLFTDGYESGNFAAWSGSVTEGTGSSAAVTTNNPHNGDYSGQFTNTAGTGGTTRRAYSYVNLDNLDEVYAWAYVYIPNDLSLANGQKLFVIQFNDAAGAALASYGVIADASGMRWAVQQAGWPSALGATGPTEGEWYLLEAYYNHAASGPTLTLKVDEVEAASLTYDTSSANLVASARFGQAFYNGAGALTVYIDDIAVNDDSVSITNYNINLQSEQDTTATSNLGSITCDGTNYSLPAQATKTAGTYTVVYSQATGYSFDHWETTGAITVTDINAASTTITISDDCTLKAVYTQNAPLTVQDALIVRGTDNNLYYRTYDGSTWSEWQIIPGQTNYEPAAAIYNGKLHVAIVGQMYNAIYWGSVDLQTGEFSGWTWIEGASDSTPALVATDNGLCLLVRGTDSNLYYRTYDGIIWNSWQIIPGQTNYEPAAAFYDGKLHVAIVGTMYNAIYWGSVDLTTGDFSGWTWIEGSSDSTPALAATDDVLCLIVRGTDNLLYYRTYDESAWSPTWSMIPGETLYEPAAVGVGNRLDIAIVGTMYNAIYWGSVDPASSNFSGWTWIQGASDSTPALA